MKKCIFTFIFNDYDRIKPFIIKPEGWDMYCFTDNLDQEPNRDALDQYTLIKVDEDMCPRRLTRKVHLKYWEYLPEKYDIVLSLGAQLLCKIDLNEFVKEQYEGHDITISKHSARKCIYKEAERVAELKKDDADVIKKQMDKYRKEGFPEDFGLIETGVIIRTDNKSVRDFCERWWNEIENGSLRDQLCFNYVLWRYGGITLKHFTKEIMEPINNMFRVTSHRKK